MKNTLIKNSLLIALIAAFVFACTYQEDIDLRPSENPNARLVNQFLSYGGSESGIKQMITGLRARNNETPFILNMMSKYGTPSWGDALIIRTNRGGEVIGGEATEAFNQVNSATTDQITEEYQQILVPVVQQDTVTSIVLFIPVDGEMNIYQVHSRELLDEIGYQRPLEEGERTLGAAFLRFENKINQRTEVKIGEGVFKIREQDIVTSSASSVYFVWNHECTRYDYFPGDEGLWAGEDPILDQYECEWVLYQVTTTNEPIPDGPDDPSTQGPGQGGLPDFEILTDSTDTCKTSKEEIKAVFSNLSSSNAEKVAEAINDHGKKFGIDTEEKLAHFLAQAGKETAGLTLLTELTSWSEAGLLSEFSNRFSKTDTTKKDPSNYARNGPAFANLVYANRNGNGDEASGDGYKYRGRGIIQITGKEKYQSFTTYYQSNFNSTSNFVTNPDLISNDIKLATIVSMWFWQRDIAPNVSDYSSTDDAHKEITELVRNTEASWEERKAFFEDLEDEIDCAL